ncbi:hypothetical protein [Methylobacter luteus]|uniref:hypothetical protein n=1 Tax=Methylobacter luteus TaxID=415 RepID=UPI000403CC0F|nr:hypothetical protein [Methylobacter luteus]
MTSRPQSLAIMFIRQIHYLLALFENRTFRPGGGSVLRFPTALSPAIQHLEEEPGITIVQDALWMKRQD